MKAMNGAGTRLLQTIRDFTVAQRTLAIIGVGVLVLGGIALTNWLGKPTYAPLFTGLSSSDASGVVAQLQKDKVDYQIADGGATLLVPADKVDAERLAAASAGLPSGSTKGYSLLDDMGVTASEFQQNVTYKRAIEGELAKAIESINGVSSAMVLLAIPQQTVFTSEQQDPTASVTVNVGTPLTSDQVSAIAHLVSAAYPGLKDSNVSIVDQNGDALSAVGGSPTGSASEQASDYESRTRAAVQAMLDKLVGPGNSTVTVAADISSSSGTTKSTTYTTPSQAPALSESSSKSTYAGDGSASGTATSGVLGNDTTSGSGTTTSASGSGGTGTAPSYGQEQVVKNNAVNTTTTEQTIVPGTLNRQTIAVAINSSVTGISTSAIQQLVDNAAGVNPTRGDLVQVTQMPFSTAAAKTAKAALAQAQTAQSAAGMSQIISSAIQVVGGLLGFIILIIVLKKLFKRDPSARDAGRMTVVPTPGAGDPVLGGTAPTQQLGGMNAATMQYAAMPPAPGTPAELTQFERLQADVDALAGADPERTADYLRALMADGVRS